VKQTTARSTDDFVERMGEWFALSGQQRITGRVLGVLLVCDPPDQSIDDLVERTGASKASVSITLRLLTTKRLVERLGRPGERRAYYRLRPGAWTTDMQGRAGEFGAIRQLAEEGLRALGRAPAAQRARLEVMRDFYGFLEREFPALIDRWLATRR
jgi:DNA-binding transcriptional ArsR family regulator